MFLEQEWTKSSNMTFIYRMNVILPNIGNMTFIQ